MTATFKACHRYARMGQLKAKPVMDMVRGMPAGAALDVLKNDNHRASAFIYKVLASAIANALQNPDVRPNRLMIEAAYVQQGPLLAGRLRYRPASMGRAMPIRKRTCHLHIVVSDPGLSPAQTQTAAAGAQES